MMFRYFTHGCLNNSRTLFFKFNDLWIFQIRVTPYLTHIKHPKAVDKSYPRGKSARLGQAKGVNRSRAERGKIFFEEGLGLRPRRRKRQQPQAVLAPPPALARAVPPKKLLKQLLLSFPLHTHALREAGLHEQVMQPASIKGA